MLTFFASFALELPNAKEMQAISQHRVCCFTEFSGQAALETMAAEFPLIKGKAAKDKVLFQARFDVGFRI